MGLPEDDPETKARLIKFRNEIEKLGWSEGHNVRIEVRFAPAGANALALANELIALQPDVILAHSAQIAGILHQSTQSIPIVFVNVSDPAGAGFIESLARPGSNFTGVLHYEAGIVGKWLAMLKEISPHLARAALMADLKSPVYTYFVRAGEAAARPLAFSDCRSGHDRYTGTGQTAALPARSRHVGWVRSGCASQLPQYRPGLLCPPHCQAADGREIEMP